MGTKCIIFARFLSGLAVIGLAASPLFLPTAEAQLARGYRNQGLPQQAYYQPLAQRQYEQHARLAQQQGSIVNASYAAQGQFQGSLATPGLGRRNVPSNGLGVIPREAPVPTRTIQERAEILLQQQAQASFSGRQRINRLARRGSIRGYARPIQQDNSFEGSVAPINQEPLSQEPVNPDQDQIDLAPFADPPESNNGEIVDPDQPLLPSNSGQDTDPNFQEFLKDPVLPDDAQIDTSPLNSGITPDSGDLNPQKPEDIDYPPGAERPDEPDPQDDPEDGNFEEQVPREPRPLPKRYVPDSAIYRQPERQMPELGDLQQGFSYAVPPAAPFYDTPQYNPPAYNPPAYGSPAYAPPSYHVPNSPPLAFEPAYQPIPGLAAEPVYQQPPRPLAVPQPVTQGANLGAIPSGNVYNDVVGVDCSQCQPHKSVCPNFYFSFLGGWSGLRDLGQEPGTGEFSADGGTAFAFALGRRNGRNLRTELELSFRQNDISGFSSGNVTSPFTGEVNSFNGMANAYWELIDVPTRCFKPYIGAGVGFISIDTEINNGIGQSIVSPGADNDTSFAYQWMVGVNYKAYRNMDFFAEYRFLKADTFRVDVTEPGVSGRYDYTTDNVFIGMRWKF